MNIVSFDEQDKIRQQLKDIMIKNPYRVDYLAKEIGVATPTLMRFLANHYVSLKTIIKIMKWIEDNK
jgi:predicted transcriptional regulator